jgi:hypothetical protein
LSSLIRSVIALHNLINNKVASCPCHDRVFVRDMCATCACHTSVCRRMFLRVVWCLVIWCVSACVTVCLCVTCVCASHSALCACVCVCACVSCPLSPHLRVLVSVCVCVCGATHDISISYVYLGTPTRCHDPTRCVLSSELLREDCFTMLVLRTYKEHTRNTREDCVARLSLPMRLLVGTSAHVSKCFSTQ